MYKYCIHNVKQLDQTPVSLAVTDSGQITYNPPAQQVLNVTKYDGRGATLFPGLIDMQVHLREPGQEYKEDISSATHAAVAGGVVAVASMPNTSPAMDNAKKVQDFLDKVSLYARCHVYPIACMTQGLHGEQLCQFQDYQKLQLLGVTDDGVGVQDHHIMREAFIKAQEYNLTIFQHCEFFDSQLSSDESEWKMIARDLELLAKYGGHYHVLHLSTAQGVNLIKQARETGLNVTCEVTPHHLVFHHDNVAQLHTCYKMNPPIRSRPNQEAMVTALLDGTIDYIATDHAPHAPWEKQVPYHQAPNGIIGLESLFPVIYTNFVKNERISMKRFIELMSVNAHNIYQLGLYDVDPHGQLQEGSPANFTMIDLNTSFEFSHHHLKSKAINSPFLGQHLWGKVAMTVVQGEIEYLSDHTGGHP